MPERGTSFKRLRHDDRRYGLPRFLDALTRAADAVASERAGSVLVIGDLSAPRGGQLLPHHASHRTGRDADLLFYLTTTEGVPVESPGFVSVGRDGLAFHKEQNRWLRLDVEREWLLVRSLVTDDDARVQWLFVHDNVRALLLEWAVARGEEPWIVQRAMDLMLQPHPGGPHDDHIHVRTACTDEEIMTGCEPTGPGRPWLARKQPAATAATTPADNATLLRTLVSDEP
jgi:penicillin-insensitive murein endopeptidase